MSATTAVSHTLPLRNCYWVVPGLLLAGEHPNGPTRDKTKERLKKLMGAGIECFVDLTKPTELLRYDTFLPFYVEYARKSIKDHGIPTGRSQMTEILEYIANSLRAGRPVYVHCRAGIGRTGTVAGCFLAERGLQGNDAIDELNRLWQQCRRSRSWPFVPETDAQAHYVREWKPTLDSGFELSSLASAVATVGTMTADRAARGGMVGVADSAGGLRAHGDHAAGAGRAAGAPGHAPGAARTGGASHAAGSAGSQARAKGGADGNGGAPRAKKTSVAGAGRTAGAGLRAAAEQARAAVVRGEVQVKAPPVPASSGTPTATPSARRGRATASDSAPASNTAPAPNPALTSNPTRNAAPHTAFTDATTTAPQSARPTAPHSVPDTAATAARATAPTASPDYAPNVESGTGSTAAPSTAPAAPHVTAPRFTAPPAEFEKGEISPSIRAEIADAIAGRNSPTGAGTGSTSFFGSHGTAAPNDGEEAPWASTGLAGAAGRSSGTDRRSSGADGGRSATEATGVQPEVAPQGPVRTQPPAGTQRPAPDEPPSGTRARDPAPGQPIAGPRDSPPGKAPASSRSAAPGQPAAAPWDPAPGQTAAAPWDSVPGQPAAGPWDSATPSDPRPDQPARSIPAPATHQPPVHQDADADPFLDPDTLAVARGLRERFVGTLFGLAVGDAVAAATQFRRPGSFTPVGDMLGGGPFDLPRGAWSDDTAMALCLAESLLERDGFDARDQVQRYSRWQQDGYLTSTGQCVGISANTARSLALAKWRRGLVFPGSHDPDQIDPDPLSRIASIALFYFASLDTTLLQAADSARITCQAPAVLDACKRLGRALNAALSGQPKTKILAEAGPLSEAAAQTNTNAASALSAAFWAFSSTDNFRDAILRAANVGGNSDVVAAVCGQLAGAHYGATAIPQSWRSGLIQKDLIEGIADRMLAHALVSLSS